MKAVSQNELLQIIHTTKVLEGARLQEVVTQEELLAMAFWSRGQLLWLMVDLNPWSPLLLPFSELPVPIKNKKSPLNLFLRAHFVGKILRSVLVPPGVGRVVWLDFGGEARLELRLFPHGQNAIARAVGKQISSAPVAPLVAAESDKIESAPRGLEILRKEWSEARSLRGRRGGRTAPRASSPPDLGKMIAKREQALEKVEAEIRKKQLTPFREIGDWIVRNQSLEVPFDWLPFVDKRRKLSWNVDQCFARAKELERKVEGTEERARKLREEIALLREREALGLPVEQATSTERVLPNLAVEARTLHLSPDVRVVAGKSASDNMKLLRKARAWDFWIHIKDHPSSHAIVFRNKKSELSQVEWQQVAQWFLRTTFASKWERHQGEKFEILIAECRHITPIKGDKAGRVNYRNERVLATRLQPQKP